MTIVVTGAAGFIGYHVSQALLARGEDVLGIDSLNDYYDPALAGAEDVFSAGATGTYYHQFGRLSTSASVGLYHFRVGDGIDDSWRAQALLGARYSF